MTGFLLDTNVLSAMRAPGRQDAAFQRWLRAADTNDCHVSVLTWMELRVGALKKLRDDRPLGRLLADWLTNVRAEFAHRTLPFDDAVAAVAAPLWLLRSRGTVDTLIAATALSHELCLVTRNTTDFEDVPTLATLNPWAESNIGP